MSQIDIPVNEVFWDLVHKADRKFSKIRNLPYHERTRYDMYFYKVFKVYTKLWKYQQENRQKLVEAGIKRWQIGDIASRIGQLYIGHYMRTSEASYLSDSYTFYEAILTREYFMDGPHQDVNLANKQLRFLSRFLTVCLMSNRREMVIQLVHKLKVLLDECKRTFQDTDFKEWKIVIQEIVKFLKADSAFMNIRPLRYSVVLDLQPDCLPCVDTNRKLKLGDAVVCSYHPNEVKFSELTIDTFRILQSLEWEPCGAFYQPNMAQPNMAQPSVPVSGANQNGASGTSRINQDIRDPALPPNPRKAILYHPAVTQLIAVLGTICVELPSDAVLLIYISASGSRTAATPSVSHAGQIGNTGRNFQFPPSNSNRTSAHPSSTGFDGVDTFGCNDFLHIAPHGHGGMNNIYPSDLLLFTRRPLFLIIDSDSSKAFKVISGAEKGEPVAMLLSPTTSFTFPSSEFSRQSSGSLFTSFLAAPLPSFILLLGFTGSDVEKEKYTEAEGLFLSLLNQWGSSLATAENLQPAWAQILTDPFLRRFILRFIFCRAVFSLYTPTFNKMEYQPECMPPLPEFLSPMDPTCQNAVFQLADFFGCTDKFNFSDGIRIADD